MDLGSEIGAFLVMVTVLLFLFVGAGYAASRSCRALRGYAKSVRRTWRARSNRKCDRHAAHAATYLSSTTTEHRGLPIPMYPTILSSAGTDSQQSSAPPGQLLPEQYQESQEDYADYCRALTAHAARSHVTFNRVEQIGLYLTLLDARREKLEMRAATVDPSRKEEGEEVQG